MEEREYTIDELSSPYEEGMGIEISPAMQYFAEGGSVDERGLFAQQIPQRPQIQQRPQPQQLKRTAAEMLQKMPQVAMGTMRFSPLTMPGVSGRPVQQFADGGEVGGMTPEERQRIQTQVDMGAPVDNLFGANLATPAPAAIPSFETNVPTFAPTYTPPTGPVGVGGEGLGVVPTGLGAAPSFTYAGTQQAAVPATAKSLFEQITPSTLAAAPYNFQTGTSYTPTEQEFKKPELISKEAALLRQPVLTRYEPDIKYGGLTTYLGPLQTSPYKDTEVTGGAANDAMQAPQWKTYGFTESGAGSAEPTFWYNRNLGVSFTSPTGGLVPPSADWTGTAVSNIFKPTEDTVVGGVGNDTVAGGGQVNWADVEAFPVEGFTMPTQRPAVSSVVDVFKNYGGVETDLSKNFQSSKFGWDKDTQSFNLNPTALSNILQ